MGTTLRPAAPALSAQSRTLGALEERLLRKLSELAGPAPIRFCLGEASTAQVAGRPMATIRFRDRAALLSLALDPVGRFGDVYARREVEVEGDLVGALEAVYRALAARPRPSWFSRIGTLIPHSLGDDDRNVHHHYDLGNDFYRSWLDDELVYTCAYFEDPDLTLEQAQVAKMDLVCRKLGLRSGETVIEAGCGWGALALHMAKQYGVRVRAYNISRAQIDWARRRAESEGMAGRVEFCRADYRDIAGRCDAFVSVGMLEHVGRGNYRDLGRVIARTLDPERGRGLLHFIGRDRAAPLDPWIRRRIFPGAYAPTLDEAVSGVLAPARMSVLDVENLRRHYAQTVRHWRLRYESALGRGEIGFDDRFRRTWHLYLAGSEAAFGSGWLQLFQVVFAPAGSNAIPWTRQGLYRNEGGSAWNAPTS